MAKSANVKASETITGTYKVFSNGFTRLKVNSNSNSNISEEIVLVRSSDEAAFLAHPYTSEDSVIAMITSDNCPSGDLRSNYIRYQQPSDTADDESDPYDFGTLHFQASSKQVSINERYELSDPTPDEAGDSFVIDSESCEEGFSLADEGTHYFSGGDRSILDLDPSSDNGGQRLFGLDITTISAKSGFDADYVGFIFDPASHGEVSYPVKGNCVSGECKLSKVSDIENGELDEDYSDFSLSLDGNENEPSNGFITGQFSFDEDAETIVCMFDNGDRYMLVCAGYSPNDSAKKMNIFLSSVE